jgi:Zn-dependent protease
MNASLRVGRIAGIPIEIHVTFAALLAWVVLTTLFAGGGPAALFVELIFVGLVFGTVLLHELGHAFMGRQFGVKTHAITLLPIGGVARMDGAAAKPAHEILIALAGPAVNMALATLLLPLVFAFSGPEALVTGHGLAAQLLWVNVGLALFNLIPAFPMDGGRVLRSTLTMHMGTAAASVTAATVGQVAAVGMGLVGLFANPMLIVIALFIWSAAEQEKHASEFGSWSGRFYVDNRHDERVAAHFDKEPPRVIVRYVVHRGPFER